MNDPIFSPCPAWAEKLAVFQSKEFSSSERNALDTHIASCSACKAVLDNYLALDERLHEALNVRRPLQVSAELLELENRDIFEEESEVSEEIKGNGLSRRKLIYRSVPKKWFVFNRISSAGKIFDTLEALLAVSIIIIGFGFLYIMKYPIQGNTSTLGSPASLTTVIPNTTPHSNVTTGVLSYPVIAPSYSGTVLDLLNNEKTSLFLTQIHQNRGNITGHFQGLAMAGPFTGIVTHTGHLQYTLAIVGGSSFLSFDGDIKIGGDITGNFKILNQQRQFTGESGVWNASSHR